MQVSHELWDNSASVLQDVFMRKELIAEDFDDKKYTLKDTQILNSYSTKQMANFENLSQMLLVNKKIIDKSEPEIREI